MIVWANVKGLEPQYKEITHRDQNCFVAGRKCFKHIIDIDSLGRIYSIKFQGSSDSLKRNTSNIPMTGAFDFEAAFPSVIQQWTWLVLKHGNLPESFLNLFRAISENAMAIFMHNGKTYEIIVFLSGVLQGCPGSALLFNNVLDPFLFDSCKVLQKGSRDIVRVCVDDFNFRSLGSNIFLYFCPVYERAG